MPIKIFGFGLGLCIIMSLSSLAWAEEVRIQLTPQDEARLVAPMSGQIISVYYKDGEVIKKNKPLIKFKCDEANARLAQVKARVDRTKNLAEATAKLVELEAAGIVELNVKKADLAEARAEQDLAKLTVKRCTLYAPFNGRISQLDVKSYDIVQQGQPLIEMLNDTTLYIEMIVPSKWMAFLKPEFPFEITVDEMGKSYKSEVIRVGGKVDSATQSVKIYGRIKNKDNILRAGMSGYAQITPPNESIINEKNSEKDIKREAEGLDGSTVETNSDER